MPDNYAPACPVCAALKWARVYSVGQWQIKECPACGLARIDPLPAAESRPRLYSQEKVVARNAKEQTRPQKLSRSLKRFFNRLAKRDKKRIFYQKFSRYLPTGAKILDIGCGDGSFLELAKADFICAGIEISEYLAVLAKQDTDLRILTGDFLSLDLAGEKFDGISLISLLEHLPDPQAALKKCFACLNPGGVLLMKTVNYACLNRLIKGSRWTGLRPPDHIFYFNPANLRALLEKIGFSKIKVYAWPFNDNMYCDAFRAHSSIG